VPSDVDEELIDAYNDLEINPPAHRKPESTKKNTTKAHSKSNQHNKRKRSNKKTVKKDPSYIGHIKEAKLFKKESPLGHLDLKVR
jgi:ethanolamine utilization cobalamin adenosyltransferase